MSKVEQQSYQTTKQQAAQYAKENKKTVAIYKEGSEYFFIEADRAGGFAIIEYVSGYN